MIAHAGENSILTSASMGLIRKILIFIVITSSIIAVGRFLPKVLPKIFPSTTPTRPDSDSNPNQITQDHNSETDSINALPDVLEDTTGGKWQSKLFSPLLTTFGLPEKQLKPKKGFFEIVFPKGKPIHEYALDIEKLCKQNDIVVEEGVELHPTGRRIEYRLSSNGQHIKLRASLGNSSMAGSAKLAIIFTNLDSLKETELSELENANWEKTLSVNAYGPNIALKKLRYTSARNDLLLDLPMEPSNYPYIDPGKHGLFIHQTEIEIKQILSDHLDSFPKAVGYTTKYGDRAIENQPLLDKVFQFTSQRNLLFLDVTGSQRSMSRQSAAAQSARCRTATPFIDGDPIEDELIKRALLAQKTGEAILVLKYSTRSFKQLTSAMAANANRFDEIGLEFVNVSHLLAQSKDSLIIPATPAPQLHPTNKTKVPLPPKATPAKASPQAKKTSVNKKSQPSAHNAAHPAHNQSGNHRHSTPKKNNPTMKKKLPAKVNANEN